jgi:hypothetical protein
LVPTVHPAQVAVPGAQLQKAEPFTITFFTNAGLFGSLDAKSSAWL